MQGRKVEAEREKNRMVGVSKRSAKLVASAF